MSASDQYVPEALQGSHASTKPRRSVTFESREGPTPFHYRYTIEPNGEGSLLTLDAEISSAGLPGPLAHLDGIATRAFRQGMRQNLEGLKHLVESDVPHRRRNAGGTT